MTTYRHSFTKLIIINADV